MISQEELCTSTTGQEDLVGAFRDRLRYQHHRVALSRHVDSIRERRRSLITCPPRGKW